MTTAPPTIPTDPRTPAPIVGWIRRHRILSTITAVFVGLMILGGISNAMRSHNSGTSAKTNSSGSATPCYQIYVGSPCVTPQQYADYQQQVEQAQQQGLAEQQAQAAQQQANNNQFEQGLGYAGSQ
jgi:hypothetical protein